MTEPAVDPVAAAEAFERAVERPSPVRVAALEAAVASRRTGGEWVLAEDAVPVKVATSIVESRRMVCTRTVLESIRMETLTGLVELQRSHLPTAAGYRMLSLLDDALLEVESAERGCGAEPGECTCPCHAGVLGPESDASEPDDLESSPP